MKKHFFLRPMDTLFFRDGKPFGQASRSSSGIPTPQTLYGAVLTAILAHFKADFEKSKEFSSDQEFLGSIVPSAPWLGSIKIKGPWVAKKSGSECDVFYNTPSILLHAKNELDKQCFPILPRDSKDIPGWDSNDGLRPLWTNKISSESATGFLSQKNMSRVLNSLPIEKSDIIKTSTIYEFQNRTGIGIDPDTNTTEQSIIYAANHLCMKDDFGFCFEMELPDIANSISWESIKTLSWGGENKRVLLEPISEINHPEASPISGRKPFVVLTTPAFFDPQKPWKPECFQKTLCAASVPSSFCVSGWNFRTGGPKPARFGVPVGSTFFLENDSEIPSSGSLCSEETARIGWGCFLKGVWQDE